MSTKIHIRTAVGDVPTPTLSPARARARVSRHMVLVIRGRDEVV